MELRLARQLGKDRGKLLRGDDRGICQEFEFLLNVRTYSLTRVALG